MKRWRKRLLKVFGGLALLAVLFGAWVWLFCIAKPPELDYRPAILDAAAPSVDGPRTHFGRSWFEPRPGASQLYLEGDPYTLGFANARLTEEYLRAQEKSLLDTVRGFFPGWLEFSGIALVVVVNNRNLPDYVDRRWQLEIRGLADGCPDPFPEYGPRYHRLLNYHAAHDISHWVWDKPVVGCTAFAARGKATTDGHLLVGRNFDFEAGRIFDTNKIITCYRPDEGHAFLSVAWAGMAGAVTGLNEQKIFCAINGAHSADKDNIGTPVSLVVRDVLQFAGSIDEAIAIIEEAKVFVSDSYLLADGKTGDAVVVEKSPARTGVRRIEDDILLQANHFESGAFADDEGNRAYMDVGTSLDRRARLAELVAEQRGRLDPRAAAAILRDTRTTGGLEIALGNRCTINACIATHSVVADVTRGILWVSRGPHQLGEYDAYAIDGFGTPPVPALPADPLLKDGRYEKLQQARSLVEAARDEWEDDERLSDASLTKLHDALELNPGDADALTLLGRDLEASGDAKGALARYREALQAVPAFQGDRRELKAAIERLQ